MAFLHVACGDPARAPNVLLVSIDTLRADHLGAYGYALPTSPALDRLAADGVVFESAMAPRAETWPSLTSLLTSRYPGDHGVRRNGQPRLGGVSGLPERLAQEGYETVAFLANMLSTEHPGFSRVERFDTATRDREVTRAALAWLRERDGGPFFAWLHYMAPHEPYAPPPPFGLLFHAGKAPPNVDGRFETLAPITLRRTRLAPEELAWVLALYDGEVAFADAEVGRVLDALDRHGLADDTLVVFTADHGEELYERNFYFFHACSIYDSTLHVPLVLRWPGRLPAGRRVEALVELTDVAPTVLALLGLEVPEAFAGRSLAELAHGADAAPGRFAFAEIGGDVRSVRTPRWRYVANPDGAAPVCSPFRRRPERYRIGRRELYDLAADPGEQRDVAAAHPDVVRELDATLDTWAETHARPTPAAEIRPDAAAELRALGYID